MTDLNPEALEKAQEAVKHMGTRVCTVEAAICTYLTSLPPVEAEQAAGYDKLVKRLQQYEGQQFETTACYNGLRDEAAAAIIALQGDRDHWKAQAANDAASAAIWQDRAEAAEAEVARLKDELAWYGEEAAAIARNFDPKSYNDTALLASMQVLALDGGRRARSFRDGQKTGEEGHPKTWGEWERAQQEAERQK